MKKLTIRVEDYMYDRLNLTATENKTSVNKIIASVLKQYMDQPKEINFLKEIDDRLNNISKQIDTVSKRQYLHFNVSSQHFANHSYLSNADVKEDKCLNEVLGKNKMYHE